MGQAAGLQGYEIVMREAAHVGRDWGASKGWRHGGHVNELLQSKALMLEADLLVTRRGCRGRYAGECHLDYLLDACTSPE
eukprot:scaffold59760_cov23-Tisochrysis_lutea.AAC.2